MVAEQVGNPHVIFTGFDKDPVGPDEMINSDGSLHGDVVDS